jgi:chromosomal replication initiation ATPase DnaA
MIFVRDIQRAVAEDHGLPVETMTEDIGFGAGKPERAWPRQDAMLLARRMTRKTYPLLGHLFNRDHSSIIHGVRSARRRCLADRKYLARVCAIRAKVLAK